MHSAETLDMHLNVGGSAKWAFRAADRDQATASVPCRLCSQHFLDNALSAVLSIAAA